MSAPRTSVAPQVYALEPSWTRAGWRAELYEPDELHARPILTLTLSRPQALNALDPLAMEALGSIVARALEMDLGALILTGGGGHFIAGGDLKALSALKTDEEARALSRVMQEALHLLASAELPVICALEGFAIGGGAELSLACDLCVMARDAYIRFAQRALGLSTAWGGSSYLRRAVGARQAFALLSQDRKIYGPEALSLGLAHQLAEPGEALQVALNWAQQLASTPEATRALKALCTAPSSSSEEALLYERARFAPLWTSQQHWDRVEAWAQRRAPRPKQGASTSAMKRDERGLFIVFEGIDGSGTTTQAERLTELIKARGAQAHFTNEPSEGVLGALTRRALKGEPLGRDGRALPAQAIALMFAADRADHWHNEIEPRLAQGVHVICDRYLYSSLAYQSLENPERWVRALNSPFPQPDLLIYLQASAGLASQRRAQRGLEADRYERDELQARVAEAYDRICAEAGALILDASLSIEALEGRCAEAFELHLAAQAKA